MEDSKIAVCLAILISGSFSLTHRSPTCDFKNDEKLYVCRYVTDTNAFPKLFYGNYHLKCEQCNIKIFYPHTFPHENNLISFNASDSGLQYISTAAFSSLGNVQDLYLQNNRIMNISKGAFAGLRQVYNLNLDKNFIVDLTPGFLIDIEVNTVTLSSNRIHELPDNIFGGVLALMQLDLQNNKIKTIEPDAFAGLEYLESLEVQNNQICYLPLGLFKHTRLLRKLNLANNKLTRFPLGTFSGLTDLDVLILANNSMEVFEGSELLPMQRLSKLDLSGNKIYYLDSYQLFTNVPSLRYLHIEDNTFSCPLLMNIVRYFKDAGVGIISDRGRYSVQNINGIACIDNVVTESVPFDSFLKKAQEEIKNKASFC